MRIQHNIMAMNSYRNYTQNTGALSKNLEKLSSGYKINRAGDDAAGLAISEKMRAQITGLKTAQKNAKDGISLIQTAEGALTEVHSMLNRMVELADQSANGTYDNEVDRANLQKEFDALRTEVDRVADASNFNGIKLLDGSLSTKGSSSATVEGGFDDIRGALAAGIDEVKAVKATSTIQISSRGTAAVAPAAGQTFTLSIGMSDGSKHEFSATVKEKDDGSFFFVDQDGNELSVTLASTATNVTTGNIQTALKEAIENTEFGKNYAVTTPGANTIKLEAKVAGADTAHVTSVGFTMKDKAGSDIAKATGVNGLTTISSTVVGKDAHDSLDLSDATIYDGKKDLDKSVFEINGEKFVFIEKGAVTDDALAAMKEAGITHYVEVAATGVIDGTNDVKAMVEKIKMATGLDVKRGTTSATGVWTDAAAGTHIVLNNGTASKKNGGLTLQIGDTAESFNQLTVSVNDMHAKALGLDKIGIGEQANALDAVSVIKSAINSVSSTRGDLGALQNRLEHTINNLSVMQENIQDAEASIRDVDVAEEMMSYTKNNILVQSAQAMLAQANQVPQGVLQLLQ